MGFLELPKDTGSFTFMGNFVCDLNALRELIATYFSVFRHNDIENS